MKVAIMQPYFFPYIGYFQLINAVDRFVIYDDVNFINRGWINRNNILLNGAAHLVNVPLQKASQNKLIHEIPVDPDEKWRIKLSATIKHAYARAPFFQVVMPLLESVVFAPVRSIAELNVLSIKKTSAYLGIPTSIIESSTRYENSQLKAQARIVDICIKEGASQYINPIGGKELYNRSEFESTGIKLNFIRTSPHTYSQLNDSFVPNLSILDVMMFNSIEEVQTLLQNAYELE